MKHLKPKLIQVYFWHEVIAEIHKCIITWSTSGIGKANGSIDSMHPGQLPDSLFL